MMKGSIQQEATALLNTYAPNIAAPKCVSNIDRPEGRDQH